MRTHTSLLIVAAAISLASAALTAQRGARARLVAPEAVRRAEQDIEKAAATRGIQLTDSARQALAKEAIHQEATAPAGDTRPVTGALSGDKLSALLTPLADAPPEKKLDVREVETRVVGNKARQVASTLSADIKVHEQTSGKVVPEELRPRLTEVLRQQSDELSRSGLAVEAIRQRNEQTLKAIDGAVG